MYMYVVFTILGAWLMAVVLWQLLEYLRTYGVKSKIHSVICVCVFKFEKETDGKCVVIRGSCSDHRSFNTDMMYGKLCVATIHAIVLRTQEV